MATVNFGRREILCKIVYYGPALCGKTTNLKYIHSKAPAHLRGNLTSIATKSDRTLFFDLLPLEFGKFRDFTIKIQLYTVPGQVFYNASRKIVLKGADGVVFVADSQMGKMDENRESLANLRSNLLEQGVDIDKIPLVFQYNKRDLQPTYTLRELNEALNPKRLQFNEAIALSGQGVLNSLKRISLMVIEHIKVEFNATYTNALPPKKEPAPNPSGPTTTDGRQVVNGHAHDIRPVIREVKTPIPKEPIKKQSVAPPVQPAKPVPVIKTIKTIEETKLEESDEYSFKKKGFWGFITSLFKRKRKNND